MKIRCPKCDQIHDTESAVAEVIQCECGEWFRIKPQFRTGGRAKFQPPPASGPPLAFFIWPALLLVALLLWFIGLVPLIASAFFIVLAIIGAACTQFFSSAKK